MLHVPVLLDELMRLLAPAAGEVFVDCTVGAGGHSAAILRQIGGKGVLVALDWDEAAMRLARERFAGAPNVLLYRRNFADAAGIVQSLGLAGRAHGVLLDLGVSSMQLADARRGFSFSGGLLDMRMDDRLPETAQELVNRLSARELEHLFRTYGEERAARRVAKAIVEARRRRRIRTADELAATVSKAKRRGRLHPATLVFQALRIAVNHELENLEAALDTLPAVLAPGGRMAVLSFHSLEDRLVKRAFQRLTRHESGFTALTRKPIVANSSELAHNPRARSAKLRAIVKA